ncbi:phospholipase C, phosphocholine-specific [Sphingomonas sp. BK235]|uniref:phosphocholine-specific phospholipase C n=1 Tax=Sphingomonas sp. BK235 TaxID=2512131 RepID=UPI00104B0CD3|nr:phospholipase C, phosphocholine-specific [Sphingomonas sp. BK235]TCP33594.1 phospholipase C [Sphingomonas sp. BK235]
MVTDRRAVLRATLAAAAAGAAGTPIARALALPARRRSGTIADVDHVVVLMQENRSFDHYFGALRGVRGFDDPRPLLLPGGRAVWHQPLTRGAATTVSPFRLNADGHHNNAMTSLDHGWRGPHALWRDYDAWIERKTALTMGYHDRRDLPFYYALADAFTICDAYHCSVFGSTNPNRMFLFTGTSGLSVGQEGRHVGSNVDDGNWTGDAGRDDRAFAGYPWTSYAERLERAGVSWRVYQEHDNYGDNALAYFKAFRGLDPTDPLYRRARAIVPGSTADNAAASEGEHLVAAVRRDVEQGTLPQVSWIVAPYEVCEHPEAQGMEYGQYFTARLLEALTADPAVWARTALFVTYDENDGFFDHVPPAIPPVTPSLGRATIDLRGETFGGDPLGVGPRVPMLVVSPWSKGGWVTSEQFDHTSIIRFMERRFGVMEPNITPWRRAAMGDLTGAFDFAQPDRQLPAWPETRDYPAAARAGRAARRPAPPAQAGTARQEPGQRPARALPYRVRTALRVDAAGDRLLLRIENHGSAGATFSLQSSAEDEPRRFYTVGAGAALDEALPLRRDVPRRLRLHGPNGYLHELWVSDLAAAALELSGGFDPASGRFLVAATNTGSAARTLHVAAQTYARDAHTHRIAPGATVEQAWDVRPSGLWYDIVLRLDDGAAPLMRFAGRGEDGRPGRSDPARADVTA